jgi:hypothetical protein
MRTYLDCYPCFLNQVLNLSRRTGFDEAGQRRLVNRVLEKLRDLPGGMRPPEMGRAIYRMVSEETGIRDLYAEEKRVSNRGALEIAPRIREAVGQAEDPLFAALEYSIAGNSIDFGARHDFDIMESLEALIEDEAELIKNERPELFAYQAFLDRISGAGQLLYIADNAGELVFDGILADTIAEHYPGLSITVAVREEPILNDATPDDARETGLDERFRVISSGSTAPGTLIDECSAEFRREFEEADVVISKGQGNYETLSDVQREIFLLLKIKCGVIAADTGGRLGDILLLHHRSS